MTASHYPLVGYAPVQDCSGPLGGLLALADATFFPGLLEHVRAAWDAKAPGEAKVSWVLSRRLDLPCLHITFEYRSHRAKWYVDKGPGWERWLDASVDGEWQHVVKEDAKFHVRPDQDAVYDRSGLGVMGRTRGTASGTPVAKPEGIVLP